MLHSSNSGGATPAIAGGTGATLRLANNLNSNGLFDSNGRVNTVGTYNMTTTVAFNSNGRTNRQTHSFMTFNPGGPPPPPHVAGVTSSPGNFVVPSTNPVETLSATCDIGSCGGAALSLPASAGSGCLSADIADNSLFNVSGSTSPEVLNANAQLTTVRTYRVGVVVSLATSTNNNTCFPLSLVGASGPGHLAA
jgi:hypothetical protein